MKLDRRFCIGCSHLKEKFMMAGDEEKTAFCDITKKWLDSKALVDELPTWCPLKKDGIAHG